MKTFPFQLFAAQLVAMLFALGGRALQRVISAPGVLMFNRFTAEYNYDVEVSGYVTAAIEAQPPRILQVLAPEVQVGHGRGSYRSKSMKDSLRAEDIERAVTGEFNRVKKNMDPRYTFQAKTRGLECVLDFDDYCNIPQDRSAAGRPSARCRTCGT